MVRMRRLVPLIVGAVVIWGKRRFRWTQPHWLFAVFSCLFGVLWIGVVGTTTASSDLAAFTAYQKGDYQTVEGLVSDFHPMPYEGHQEECFSVQDQRFCYSDYMITPGFHNATSHGGPIHEGLPVRMPTRMETSCGWRFRRIKYKLPLKRQSSKQTESGSGNNDLRPIRFSDR